MAEAARDLGPTCVGHDDMANAIRFLSMDAVQAAACGHPGMPMGMADVATVLFRDFLKFDPKQPDWPDRDRFVLSAGHGSMLLYSLLYLSGYPDMTIEQLRNFRQLGSRTAGHPEYGHAPGIETTTGPLGQGIATAVGMALAERLLNARFLDALVDHFTYVIASDGDLMEGVSHEAISLAGHLRLGRLIVLFDDNAISIDGDLSLSETGSQIDRFKAANWDISAVDGHDPDAIRAAVEAARRSDRPSLIACRTIIGFGAPNKAGTASAHGAALGVEEIAGTRKALGWGHDPFEIPADILSAWRSVGGRGRGAFDAWTARLADSAVKAEFERAVSGGLAEGWESALIAHKAALSADAPKMATRQASGAALDVLTEAIPELVGGSADLTGSNNTRAKDQSAVSAGDFSGSYIHYGVREHGMAAAMNGMALHGGVIPYGGTFLIFADYCRPSIRLSALMGQRVIYVMTHDSIGLGEDGPTHQPVEQLAGLRAIPNLLVFRPADAVETAECWALALRNDKRPSVLALTRQGLETVRTTHRERNACAQGGYVLAEAEGGERKATVLATGSEMGIALSARERLRSTGIPTAVVSMPCWALFDEQPAAYRDAVLGAGVRVAVEAAAKFGWERYVGASGGFVGMTGFGASGPAGDLYRHFGITADAVVTAVRQRL